MGDQIVRRGVAGSGARRSEPRLTAELGKRELEGLIRDHTRAAHADAERADLEPERELGGDVPAQLPSASSPRLLAHTLRREPTPDGMPAAPRPSTGPRAPLVERDISTIAMPRLERPASMDAMPRRSLASDAEHTRRLRPREASPARTDFDDEPVPPAADFDDDPPRPLRADFDDDPPCPLAADFENDEPVPPPADDFDAGHPVTDLAFAARVAHQRDAAARVLAISPTPRIDRELAGTVAASRQVAPLIRPRAPARGVLRVLPITLAIVVAACAGYLMLHARL